MWKNIEVLKQVQRMVNVMSPRVKLRLLSDYDSQNGEIVTLLRHFVGQIYSKCLFLSGKYRWTIPSLWTAIKHCNLYNIEDQESVSYHRLCLRAIGFNSLFQFPLINQKQLFRLKTVPRPERERRNLHLPRKNLTIDGTFIIEAVFIRQHWSVVGATFSRKYWSIANAI